MNIPKIGFITLAIAALGMVAAKGFAGLAITFPVTINTTARTAYGAMGTARDTSNTVEWIGCSVEGGPGLGTVVRCSARDSVNTAAGCSSTDSNIVAAAQSITSDSLVEFNWNTSGVCTYLEVQTFSYMQPKL